MSLAAPTTIVVHQRGASAQSLILAHLLLGVGAFLFGPTIYKQFLPSKMTMYARWHAADIGNLYPAWAEQHPGQCPTVADLVPDDPRGGVDLWGHAMTVQCTDRGVAILSAGEDGEPDTDDDIRWQE